MIAICAGHSDTPGSIDPGAVANGHKEADIVEELRDMIAERIRAANFLCITDGKAGANLPLSESLRIAKAADVKVELHCNAATPAAKGVEALSLLAQKRLSQKVAGAVAQALNLPLRGEAGWKPDDAGHHSRLAFARIGGVILELFFITNKSELDTYLAHKEEVADALAKALIDADGQR